MPLTATQIKKLGERIRKQDPPSDEDVSLLKSFLAAHGPALADVMETLEHKLRPNLPRACAARLRLHAVGERLVNRSSIDAHVPAAVVHEQVTGRIKTWLTLREKLVRDQTRLNKVQDLAGARLVVSDSLIAQDACAQAVLDAYPESSLVDRRQAPSSGYRAVHVLVVHGPFHVEVQIRTEVQHRWAEAFEKMGDAWGRQIRYGGQPDGPSVLLYEPTMTDEDPEEEIPSRAEFVQLMQSYSERIALVEETKATAEAVALLADSLPPDARDRPSVVEARDEVERMRSEAESELAAVRNVLELFTAVEW